MILFDNNNGQNKIMKKGNIDTDKQYTCRECIIGTVSCREISHGVFVAECDKCGWKKTI